MKGLDLVVLKDGEEEPGEGQDQPDADAMEKDGVDGPGQATPLQGAGLDQGLAPFIRVAGR